ncbi:hypothetical protein DRP77_09545 [Candidatus Poribacteria bacterium]|nr:MAG: hypothetical protein DRP77_09545 [Candidatus Poribacteria bacterium]
MRGDRRIVGYRLRAVLFGCCEALYLVIWSILPSLGTAHLIVFSAVNLLFWLVHPLLRGRSIWSLYGTYLSSSVGLAFAFGIESNLPLYPAYPLVVMAALDFGLNGAVSALFAFSLIYLIPAITLKGVGVYIPRVAALALLSLFAGLIGEERVRTERRLERMEDYLELLINSIKSGVVVTDIEGRVVSMNEAAEEILGYSADEMRGRKLDEEVVIHRGSSPILKALSERRPVERVDVTLLSKGGEEIPAGASVYLLEDGDDMTGAVEIFRDISDIKEREALLRRQERLVALGQMAAEVAHEIRNPLGGIRGFANLILRKAEDEAIKRHASFIIEGVESIERIVNDFLAYARPLNPIFRKADLHLLIKECLASSLEGFEGIEVKLDLSEEAREVEVDVEQMKQVFRNLFLNAAEAMPEGGRITVRVYPWRKPFRTEIGGEIVTLPPGQTVVIEVSDTGPGIPDEIKDRIFNPFFTTKTTGTGLGLAIVHRIIEAHGGVISVKDREGGGATFVIKLPMNRGGDRDGGRTDTGGGR